MGLDTIELVMETEEKFSIKLPDDELGNATTIGDLHNLVYRLCFDKDTTTCNSQRAFYKLRKIIVSELGFQKDEIHPQTQTEDIFFEENRNKTWNSVSKAAELSFPKLELPKKLLSITSTLSFCFWIATLAIFMGLISMHHLPGLFWKALPLIFVLLFFITLIAILKCSALAKCIPDSCHTLGALSKTIVYHNTDKFKPNSKNEIWEILTCLISEQSGVEVSKIKPETHFKEIFPYDYK